MICNVTHDIIYSGVWWEASSNESCSTIIIAGLDVLAYAHKAERYGFVEFEIPNCTIAAVFRQPLMLRPMGTVNQGCF